MAKFNVVQKMKRERAQERKRLVHGEPGSGKLKQRGTTLTSLSGKRKQKLLRKLRRDQKEAVEKGLVTMADVEMISAEDSEGAKEKGSKKIHMKKKSSKLQIKRFKGKGWKKGQSGKAKQNPNKADSMVE